MADNSSPTALKAAAGTLMLEAIVLILLGAVAVLAPGLFTLGVVALVGVLLVIGGGVRLYRCLAAGGHAGRGWHIAAALLALIAGVIILFHPWSGVLTLTIVLIALFLLEGLIKLTAALRFRPQHAWGWGLVSGLVDIALAVVLWAGLPGSALWAIGLLVGISLFFTGWTALMLSLAMRRMAGNAGA